MTKHITHVLYALTPIGRLPRNWTFFCGEIHAQQDRTRPRSRPRLPSYPAGRHRDIHTRHRQLGPVSFFVSKPVAPIFLHLVNCFVLQPSHRQNGRYIHPLRPPGRLPRRMSPYPGFRVPGILWLKALPNSRSHGDLVES